MIIRLQFSRTRAACQAVSFYNREINSNSAREFLPEYKGKWSPDSGPIIAGCGVAATGLGLNASSSVGDSKTFRRLEKSMSPFISLFNGTESFVGNNFITKIGTDLLASSIWLNAETKQKWFD